MYFLVLDGLLHGIEGMKCEDRRSALNDNLFTLMSIKSLLITVNRNGH